MNIKEIDLGIVAEEFQKFNVDISQTFIKGIESGRISVLPGENIETPINSSNNVQYGE